MLILLALVWGGSFFFVAVAVREWPPLAIVAARVGIAAAALNIFILLTGGGFPRGWKLWAAFLAMGVLNNVIPFTLIVWGQQWIAGGLAAILNATTPLFGVVIAHYLADNEKLTAARLFGVIAGFAGVVVMLGGAEIAWTGSFAAQLAILGAACSYGFASVFGLVFRRWQVPSLHAASGQVTASSLLLLPIVFFAERDLPAGSTEMWLALLGLGLFSTALAYLLYFRILALSGATNVLLVTFLAPISAIALGAAFLNEVLELRHFAGMACIGIGLAAIDGRLWAKLKGGKT